MRTFLKTSLKDNGEIFIKEQIKTVETLLKDKDKYIMVHKRRYNGTGIISERKFLIKKTLILTVDQKP